MFKQFYHSLNENLKVETVVSMANFILSQKIKVEESASLLTAMNFYDNQTILLQGFSKAIKNHSLKLSRIPGSIDVCGTGGDGHHTFNISTTVALLLSKVMPVIKHGNTSISSMCGSADVIHAFKIPFPLTSEEVHHSINKNNFVFLYAPYMHPIMRTLMPLRKKLGIPTIFNRIGPLCNPCQVDYQIIGVYDEKLMLPMAKALQASGILSGAVIHGHGGMDELSTSGLNKVIYVGKNQLRYDTIHPLDYEIPLASIKDYKGGKKAENAKISYDVLNGMKGPKQDIVALNAGLALYISGHQPNLSLGIKKAYQLLNRKNARSLIHQLSGGNYEYSQ